MTTNNEEFRRKRDLLNQYADKLKSGENDHCDSTIHVYDAKNAMEDYHPERIPLGSRSDDEMVDTNSGPVSIKRIKELLEFAK